MHAVGPAAGVEAAACGRRAGRRRASRSALEGATSRSAVTSAPAGVHRRSDAVDAGRAEARRPDPQDRVDAASRRAAARGSWNAATANALTSTSSAARGWPRRRAGCARRASAPPPPASGTSARARAAARVSTSARPPSVDRRVLQRRVALDELDRRAQEVGGQQRPPLARRSTARRWPSAAACRSARPGSPPSRQRTRAVCAWSWALADVGHALVRRERAARGRRTRAGSARARTPRSRSSGRSARRSRTSPRRAPGRPPARRSRRARASARARRAARGRRPRSSRPRLSGSRCASAATPRYQCARHSHGSRLLDLREQLVASRPTARASISACARRSCDLDRALGRAAQHGDELVGIGGGERREVAGGRVVGVDAQRRAAAAGPAPSPRGRKSRGEQRAARRRRHARLVGDDLAQHAVAAGRPSPRRTGSGRRGSARCPCTAADRASRSAASSGVVAAAAAA